MIETKVNSHLAIFFAAVGEDIDKSGEVRELARGGLNQRVFVLSG